MEKQHQQGEIIRDRYSILHILGQGGIGITYAAEDLQTGEKVALKAVSLRRTNDLKVLELFEREARILAQIKHPAIPRYIDYFEVGKRRDRFFYLAQQLAEGNSLAQLIANGWRPPATEVRWTANQILDILVYLQQLAPPVIHRDIKPHNIIRRDDGQIFLVDFGAVQDVYHQTITGGSTVVGTYGYMAPEQFRGKAILATDLYGLGATIIYLLTCKTPADLPQRKLKTVCVLKWKSRKYKFGTFLTEPEKAWLVAEINDFLDRQKR
jgi:eukaryotic-like serine/threonine-protein kinase